MIFFSTKIQTKYKLMILALQIEVESEIIRKLLTISEDKL
jgi:hypothetical protein